MAQNWLGHALRQTQWQPQRQAIALGVLGVFVIIIIGALYVAHAASTSTLGRQLEEMIALRNQLEQENERMRAEIAALQSVPRLLARAEEMGFIPAEPAQIRYLVVDGYNPDRDDPRLTAQQEDDNTVPIYDETFTGWVQQQWDIITAQFRGFVQRRGDE